MDPDRKRAILLTTSCTKRLLLSSEISELREYVMKGEGERGVALAMITKAENGNVLAQPDAAAIAQGFESRGEPWFSRFRAIDPEDGTVQGVMDPSRPKTVARDPSACPCGKKSCPECSGVAFTHEHGYTKNAFNKSEDCGCS